MLKVTLPNKSTIILRHRPRWVDWFIDSNKIFVHYNTLFISRCTNLKSISIPTLFKAFKHSEQQNHHGFLKWIILYKMSKKFRLQQEVEGFALQIDNTITTEARIRLLVESAEKLAAKEYGYCAESFDYALYTIKLHCRYDAFI